MVKNAVYECDWCEKHQDYEGEDSLKQAGEDGWIVMITDYDGERTFCSADCLISYL